MDILFCMDYTSSMPIYFERLRAMILRIYELAATNQAGARAGLIKFRSPHGLWKIKNHGFTQNRTVLGQWFDSDVPDEGSPDGYEAVGDALYEAVNMEWCDDNQIFSEKLVVLITDDAPNGLFGPLNGVDPWRISSQLRKKNITLVIVGVGGNIVACDDFYCALAQNTGGVYIPWINAERILSSVIQWVTREKLTFHQAFHRVSIADIEKNSSFKYSYMKSRVDGMINECATMNDIRRLFYQH